MAKKNAEMDIYRDVTIEGATQLIAAGGHRTTYLVEGSTGIGKSTILKGLAKMPRFKDYVPCYMDMTTKDLGDLMMPKFRRVDTNGHSVSVDEPGMEIVSFVPNEEAGIHYGRPLLLMLDEFGKANTSVKNAMLPTLLEGRYGTHQLPRMKNPAFNPMIDNGEPEWLETIVFATTNLAAEGLGDTLQAHQRNRIGIIRVRTCTPEEWIMNFALDAGVHPVIMSTVEQFPSMLASFDQYTNPADNPYIFFPKEPRTSFTSPRSLAKASNVLYDTEGLDPSIRGHALIGVIGKAATYDMMAIIQMHEKLPTWKEITLSPTKASVPTSPAAVIMLVYTAVQQVEKGTIKAWIQYSSKLSKEAQALFATTVLRTGKASTVGADAQFISWAQGNSYLFGQ